MTLAVISGITGYTGGRLAARLARDGAEVRGIVRKGRALPPALARFSGIRAHEYDGTAAGLAAAFSGGKVDAVYHLAARLAPSEEADAMLEANIRLGVHLLEAMLAAGCGTFINAGTFWQRDAAGAARPMNFYAATKQAFEDILAWYALDRGVKALTLVMYDIYGPEDPRGKILSLLQDAARKGVTLDMTPGRQEMCPVHVDDVVQACLRAAGILESAPPGPHRAYAVAGEGLTLREFAAAWSRSTGRNVSINWGALPYRPSQILRPWRGEPLPGWEPRITLDRGLRELAPKEQQA